MELSAAIASLLAIILWGLKQWAANSPERKDHEQQKGREDIARGDSAAVSARIDRLRSKPHNPSGQSIHANLQERIRAIHRLANSGGGIDEDSGKSGGL